MPCLFVLIFHHFKPLTEIRTNLKQIEAEAAKKVKNNEPRQNLLVLKNRVINELTLGRNLTDSHAGKCCSNL